MSDHERITEAARRWAAGEDLQAIAKDLGIRTKEVYFLLRSDLHRRKREAGAA